MESANLPSQLADVDPIVASFTGGAVGVLSMLLLVEVNNVEKARKARCVYCSGTGYLPCAQCGARGRLVAPAGGARCVCTPCSGTGKVMCTSCLCTGKAMATVHGARPRPRGAGAALTRASQTRASTRSAARALDSGRVEGGQAACNYGGCPLSLSVVFPARTY